MWTARKRLFLLLVLLVLVAGCGTRGFPALQSQRTLVAAGETMDDGGIAHALATAPHLPPRPRAALVLLDSQPSEAELDEAARSAVVEEMRAQLDRAPVAAVNVLPTTVAPTFTRDGVPSLAELRSAAARLRADVLVLATLATNDYRSVNPLAITYLAVLPMYVVPGSAVEVHASAEACAIDVRSGLFLDCASGHGESSDGFVALIDLDAASRDAAREAARAALARIPQAMTGAIAAAQLPES